MKAGMQQVAWQQDPGWLQQTTGLEMASGWEWEGQQWQEVPWLAFQVTDFSHLIPPTGPEC